MCLLCVSTGPARRHTWRHSRRFKLLKLPLLLLLLCEQSCPSVHSTARKVPAFTSTLGSQHFRVLKMLQSCAAAEWLPRDPDPYEAVVTSAHRGDGVTPAEGTSDYGL